jgi:hypothetical protein
MIHYQRRQRSIIKFALRIEAEQLIAVEIVFGLQSKTTCGQR